MFFRITQKVYEDKTKCSRMTDRNMAIPLNFSAKSAFSIKAFLFYKNFLKT